MYISWLNLKRDYVALSMVVVLPMVFFTVLVLVMGGTGAPQSADLNPIPMIVVDLDRSKQSGRFLESIGRHKSSHIATSDEMENPFTRSRAKQLVRMGEYSAAIVIPSGFAVLRDGRNADPVELLYDKSNPVVRFMVASSIQHTAMALAVNRLRRRVVERRGARITSDPQKPISELAPQVGVRERAFDASDLIVELKTTDVRGESFNQVSYYAAGIGVMFLLFSMAGAGSSNLEEVEAGTLERILNANVSFRSLLLGKWMFFTAVAILQMTLMFVWASLFFGLDLWTPQHLAGFVAMTTVTAGSAASFGLVLATVCRTRAQLSGISTIVILIRSALGGSMVPRFVMPPITDTMARFTFNDWALDGYLRVFGSKMRATQWQK